MILVFVQILLIVVAMIAFSQEWHVEEERPVGGTSARRRGRRARRAAGAIPRLSPPAQPLLAPSVTV